MTRPVLVFLASIVGFSVCANPPVLPSINTNNVFNVTNSPYNANPNGIATNTTAIQNAINDASVATGGVGGGTVELPGPGTYLCGPLAFKAKVNLQVDAGATLKFLPEASYPNASGSPNYPIAATNLNDLEISGSGTIDGNGAGWWSANPPNRPYMIYFSKCGRILIQNVTLQNPPKMHIVFKNSAANVTIQGITINTVSTSPNTDGIDLIGTNCLVQNCSISGGDDNIALGSSSATATASDIVVTNCFFGTGHGMTIGSNTQGGVSNLMVINCTFSGTEYGIRMKSDDASSGGGGEGGIAQNLSYYNLSMTNIIYGPIVIYSYYNEIGTPTNIPPSAAADQPLDSVTGFTPTWRNIVISNLTATVGSGGVAGIVWARTECPLTNLTLMKVKITAQKTFDIYNVAGLNVVDSQITPSSGSTFALFDAQVTVSNSTSVGAPAISFDGITTNGYVNTLGLFNTLASLTNTNAIGTAPVLTSGGTTLTVSNSLNLAGATVLNLYLGTNTDKITVTGSLALDGTINVADGGGFAAGTYTLFTYGTTLAWNTPSLGTTPAGFNYSFDTNTAHQVNLVVQSSTMLNPPDAPTNVVAVAGNGSVQLTWASSATATGYNVKRSTISGSGYAVIAGGVVPTNYTDSAVTNGVTYYYVVAGTNSAGEGPNSTEVSAQPTPSLAPVTLAFQVVGQQLQLTWPTDHTGYHVQIQTNTPTLGLSTNWTALPGSNGTNQISIPIDPTVGSVFVRLIYP